MLAEITIRKSQLLILLILYLAKQTSLVLYNTAEAYRLTLGSTPEHEESRTIKR